MLLRVLAATAALAAALLLWFTVASAPSPVPEPGIHDPERSSVDPAGPPAGTSTAGANGAARAPAVADADRIAHAPAAPGRDGRTAAIVVTARWGDGALAPGVIVHLVAHQPLWTAVDRRATDGDGLARFEGLAPGTFEVSSDRGGEAVVDVEAGAECRVDLELPAGIAVNGVVRDGDGRPVASAGIWLTTHQGSWLGGAVVATSGADGAFALEHVPDDQSLGALAEGFGPSALVDLESLDRSHPPVFVELRVQSPGGALAGRVTDHAQKPIARALVVVGLRKPPQPDYSRSGHSVETWTPRSTGTDRDGTFRIGSLVPGTLDVEVVAADLPYWRGTCEIEAGRETRLDIEVPAPVVVHGTVRDDRGAPMAGAIVRAYPEAIAATFLQSGQYDFDTMVGFAHAVTDPRGDYRIANATPGTIHLYAGPQRSGHRDTVPWDEREVDAAPGADVEWNPIVTEGLSIAGTVTYRDGSPMRRLFVTATRPDTDQRHVVTTDGNGEFRFVRLDQVPYDISVQVWKAPPDAPPIGARGVRPGTEDLDLRATFDPEPKLAPGQVRGMVVDTGRRVVGAEFGVELLMSGGSQLPQRVDGTSFWFDQVEPGSYRLAVLADKQTVHTTPEFELHAGEDIDLGAIETRPGAALVVRLRRGPGTENAELSLNLHSPERGYAFRNVAAGVAECRIDNLDTGTWRIETYGKGLMSMQTSARVALDGDSSVEVSLRAGILRRFVADFPDGERLARFVVRDDRGEIVRETRFARPAPPGSRQFASLAVGRYTAAIETASGRVGEVTFAVEDLAGEQPVLPIVIR